jgi:hypothetical protein
MNPIHDPDPNERMPDNELTTLLASALEVAEAVPDDAVDAAYAAIEMDLVAEELARLAFDSTASELVDMRSAGAPEADVRLLSFVNDHLTVELELHADGRTIVGVLSAPSGDTVSSDVRIESADGTAVVAPTDEFGRFRATAPTGAIRLRIVGSLVTPWITR